MRQNIWGDNIDSQTVIIYEKLGNIHSGPNEKYAIAFRSCLELKAKILGQEDFWGGDICCNSSEGVSQPQNWMISGIEWNIIWKDTTSSF